jgi:hypothetical protein
MAARAIEAKDTCDIESDLFSSTPTAEITKLLLLSAAKQGMQILAPWGIDHGNFMCRLSNQQGCAFLGCLKSAAVWQASRVIGTQSLRHRERTGGSMEMT